MTLRYNDQINPATGEEWQPGTIMAIFFCIFIGSFMIGNLDPSVKAMLAARAAVGRFLSVKAMLVDRQAAQDTGRRDAMSVDMNISIAT